MGILTGNHARLLSSIALVTVALATLLAIAKASVREAAAQVIPPPTGSCPVGRTTLQLTDRARVEPDGDRRALMVDLWYPAEPSTNTPAPYLDLPTYERALGKDAVRRALGAAYEVVKAGHVPSHASTDPPLARTARRAPLLVFSHGGGLAKEFYGAQLAELASHGYIVAAISHTYDALLTTFPGGRAVPMAADRWPPEPGEPEGLMTAQLQWWAQDIQFVLAELSGGKATALAGRIAPSAVAAFGHSAGGQAAARACQIEPRLVACLNQDGLSRFAPFALDSGEWGMTQPFMLIERAPRTTPPTDEELAEVGMTRTAAERLVAQLKARQTLLLSRTGGSHRVRLYRESTSHMDFSDLPLLQAGDDDARRQRAQVMQAVRNLTRVFFDRTTRGVATASIEAVAPQGIVEAVDWFPPVKRPR